MIRKWLHCHAVRLAFNLSLLQSSIEPVMIICRARSDHLPSSLWSSTDLTSSNAVHDEPNDLPSAFYCLILHSVLVQEKWIAFCKEQNANKSNRFNSFYAYVTRPSSKDLAGFLLETSALSGLTPSAFNRLDLSRPSIGSGSFHRKVSISKRQKVLKFSVSFWWRTFTEGTLRLPYSQLWITKRSYA